MKKYRNTYTYKKIWIKHNGPIPLDENGNSYEIHHIDGNKENNNIANLKAVSRKDHYEIHYSQGDWAACKAISMRFNIDKKEQGDLSRKIHTGRKCSQETKNKISKANKGRIQSLEEREIRKVPRPGSGPQGPRSEDIKNKMRKPRSEEAKINMRGNKKPGAGPQGPRDEKTKEKMRGKRGPRKNKNTSLN